MEWTPPTLRGPVAGGGGGCRLAERHQNAQTEEGGSAETRVSWFGRSRRPSLRSERVYLAHGHPRPSTRFAGPSLRCGPLGDCRGPPCGKPLRASRRLALVQREQARRLGRCLFVSFIAVDRPRKVHPLAPPGWERRGWRWSDREPLGRTGAGTEFGRHRLFLRPEWIHEREGSKTSTGAGKDARSYRSRH